VTTRVWYVSGASSGLGEAFARRAIHAGDAVVVTARRADRLEALHRLAPDRVLVHRADLAVRGEAARSVEAALRAFGRIDVVINNAGVGMLGAVEETSDDELRALFDVNFHGGVETIRAVLPHMREARRGTIVNVSSFLGQLSIAGLGAYSATKFALEGLSEALAAELAPFGIRVLILEPGGFRTGFNGPAFRRSPALPAYEPQLGPLRARIEELGREARGDPALAADALVRLLDEPALPLRIQFGSDSTAAIGGHSRGLLDDLQAWRHVAESTDRPRAAVRSAQAQLPADGAGPAAPAPSHGSVK
jgi:NAD(P)-dependent dehydrogenase (short-subunit alcohol dehydrogenase family)